MSPRHETAGVEWLRKLARISPVGIFRCDARGACTYVNERWCEMTGFSAAQAMGNGWQESIHPDDRERVAAEWARASRAREPFETDYRYLRPNGQIVWAHGAATEECDEEGKFLGTIGAVTDVSELQRTREELQRARDELEQRGEERLQRLRELTLMVDEMDDAVIWSDLAGRITGLNTAAEKLFGYSRAEVLGGSTLAFTPPEAHDEALQIKQRVRMGESIHQREVVRLARDGRRMPVMLSVFPLRNQAGSIVGTAAIVRNLTERKKAESRMRQLAQRLLGAQDEERRRIARELHDSTAQLLVALSISLNRLRMEELTLEEEEWRDLLGECSQLAERATAEVRTQSYLLHPPLLEERGLSAALRFFIDGFTDRSGIDVKFHAARQIARLNPLVELTLFRIVQEALANVHRHSQSARAEVALAIEPGAIALSVRDFGCGLPADPGELHGVGLAGMRERVAQLGGSLTLESGQPGVNLRVHLPLDRP